jgi:hypothetical protein
MVGNPRLVEVAAPTNTKLVLTFNEPLGASALDPANYMVLKLPEDAEDGDAIEVQEVSDLREAAQAGLGILDVLSVEPGENAATIVLTTSEQSIGTSYRVMVLDVRDITGETVDAAEDTLDVMFAGTSGLTNEDLPRVVAAASTSNTTVMVSFTKMMGDGAADPGNYAIVQANIVAEAGALTITGAQFLGGDRTAIELTTLAQSPVEYQLIAVHVSDLAGNSLAPREAVAGIILDSTTATFWGNGISCPPELEGVCANYVPAIGAGTDGRGACTADDDCGNGACRLVDGQCSNDETIRCTGGSDCCAVGEACSCRITSGTCDNYAEAAAGGTDGRGKCTSDQDCCADGQVCTGSCVTTPCELPDSDGDGLTDDLEQRGWVVSIVKTGGIIVTKDVTSDPFVRDTDGDGLDDYQEHRRCTDPRNADTDGDTIKDDTELTLYFTSMSNQDTDTDGLDDWREISVFKSSPVLDDTDGDGFRDNLEIFQMSRNPRLADLPNSQILIGNVALRLDTRFTFTDTQGVSRSTEETVQTELTQSTSQSMSTADQSSTQNVIGVKVGIKHESGGSAGVNAAKPVEANSKTTYSGEGSYEHTWGYTHTSTRESTEAAQRAYNESLTTNETIDETQSVTREVVGASIEVTVSLLNLGDTAFSVEDLEITVLQQSRTDRTQFTPIATLVPASTLDTGEELVVNLGPLAAERGPFIFKSREVFPSLVEDLMKNPRGLMFRVANLNIEDEAGRNFAFASQEVNERTAGLTIDNGAGRVERYRVATASTFDENGHAVGISMKTALQDILGFEKNPSMDVITVGPNGCGETQAAGDDVQVFEPVCYEIIRDDGVIVTGGLNGIINTEPRGDDFFDVLGVCTDATDEVCSEHPAHRIVCSNQKDCMNLVTEVIRDGGDGCAHSSPFRDDQAAVVLDSAGNVQRRQQSDCEPGGFNGELILVGPNGVLDTQPSGDDQTGTLSGYTTEIFSACDADSGQNLIGSACDSDVDCGNGHCRLSEGLVRFGGISNQSTFRCAGDSPPGAIGTLCGIDADFALPDGAVECGGGTCTEIVDRLWLLQIKGEFDAGDDFDDLVLKPGDAYFLTYIQDKDADGLTAREEFMYGSSDLPPRGENSDGCFRAQCGPCDFFDSLSDFDEVRRGWDIAVEGQPIYRSYADPVLADTDGDGLFDDEEKRFGTDALIRDTDGDGISDFEEIHGFSIYEPDRITVFKHISPYQYGAAIVAGPGNAAIVEPDNGNGTVDTEPRLDDVYAEDPSTNNLYELGANVSGGTEFILPGSNGIIDSIPCGDDRVAKVRARTSAAGDDVQVAEPNELVAAGEPVVLPGPNGRLDSNATASDIDRPEGLVYHRDRFATDPLNRDTDGDSLFDGVERNLGNIGSDPNDPDEDGANPNDPSDAAEFRDDDHDGLANREEADGWNRGVWRTVIATGAQEFCCTSNTGAVLGATCGNPGGGPGCTIVTSDPLEPDTDDDGLPDSLERTLGTDPRERDTDGDGLLDYDEFDGESRFSIAIGDFRDFEDLCFDADRCVYEDEDSLLYGTSPSVKDTDDDGRSDYEELFIDWVVAPCGVTGVDVVDLEPIEVLSDPTDSDYDNDGLADALELFNGTDPNDFDTDDDGTRDGDDSTPLGCTLSMTVTIDRHELGMDACDDGSDADFEYRFYIHRNSTQVGSWESSSPDGLSGGQSVDINYVTTPFEVDEGDVIKFSGRLAECDGACNLDDYCDGDNDEGWTISERTWIVGINVPSAPTSILRLGGEIGEDNCTDDPCLGDDKIHLEFNLGSAN